MATIFTGWSYNEEGDLIKPSGKVCNKKPSRYGYLYVTLNYKQYRQHRVIFFLKYGYWPDLVDHIDRDRLNNRPDNLRDATASENQHNTVAQQNNKQGIKGLCFISKQTLNPWRVKKVINGKIYQGNFPTKGKALIQLYTWENLL